MTGPEPPRCRHCAHPIHGVAESRHGAGWVHSANNRERGHDGHLAEPPTLADLNARRSAEARRSRLRRRSG